MKTLDELIDKLTDADCEEWLLDELEEVQDNIHEALDRAGKIVQWHEHDITGQEAKRIVSALK